MMMEREGEKENQGGEHYDANTSETSDISWASRSGSGNVPVRTKSSPKKETKGKQQQKKSGSVLGGGGDQQGGQRNTVLLLIDDEKVKPIEVDLFCKTYPKEHEAFTNAFLRQNDFARKIFAGGDRLLKWYFQEDHLTFPRLCLIYQNRCSQGRTNPWVPKLIRGGPALRGPVVLVQQKKSPNAETVVFDQYRREDRHMLPAAASYLVAAHVSCGDVPTRTATTAPAPQRNPMRASAPPLSLKGMSAGGGRTGIMAMDDSVQPQHPYLSSSTLSPTAPPFSIAMHSSLPSSPSSSSPSSSSSSRVSSPSNTPPSSLPHSPRDSFSGSMFVSSPASATRPGAPSSASSSFHALQQSDSAVPPYTSPHFYSPPLTSGGGQHESPGFDGGGLVERPAIGSSNGGIPVSRSSDEFSAFSSHAFPYSLWSYPASASAAQPPPTAPASHHQHSYSADGMLSLSGQHLLPPHHAQHQPLAQPLSLSTSGVYVPSHHQYRPSSVASRPPTRHFSWEGPLEKPTRTISGPELLRATYPAPNPPPFASAAAAAARRPSVDLGGGREGVDEQIVGQLKKIRDSPLLAKAKATRLAHAYEEYLKTREASAAHGEGAKKRSAAVGGKPSGVTRKTKLFCRTLLFDAKVAHASERCEDDMRSKRSMAKWEELMRTELRDMLGDGLVDSHLADRILLACFAQRKVQTARDLVREIAKQAPKAVSREDWALLADKYEVFSPWLATFLRSVASEKPPTDLDARDARVTLRIVRRRTYDGEDEDEEMFRTIAPLSATVDELKHKLWQEQCRLAAEGGDDRGHLLRPNDMGVLYRFKRGIEVHLQSQDTLQDFLLPHPSVEPATEDQKRRVEKDDARKARTGKVEPTPSYDMVITEEPRLLAFAHFPDLVQNLAELKSMIDSEERDLWNYEPAGRDREDSRGGMLYDYLCHHFEYLEEQNRGAVRCERKERQRRKERAMLRDERQKKDAENGYRDQGRKEKRIEAELHGRRSVDEAPPHVPKYIVRFLAAATVTEEPSTFLTAAERRDKQLGGRRVERCAIHLGSLTKEDEEPLYAVFTRNSEWPYASPQRWAFHAWSDEFSLVEKYGLSNSSSASSSSSTASTPRTIVDVLPSPPRYFESVQDLYVVPGVKIYLNAEHVLKNKANCKRFDQCAYTKDELAFVTDTARRASLDFALTRCLRSLQNDPSLAVPQSRADASGAFHLEFLAPVYVRPRKLQKPDLIVALERRYDSEGRLSCYVATSLLTLAQAFANARRVKKIRQSWLLACSRTEGLNHHYGSGQIGAKRNYKTKRNHDDDEDEFRFEAEIEKWVSETEGEESEDTEEDSSDSTTSG